MTNLLAPIRCAKPQLLVAIAVACSTVAQAQQSPDSATLPTVVVQAPAEQGAYAAQAQFHTDKANLGPLGNRPLLDTPASVTTVPEDLITNLQAQGVNDTLWGGARKGSKASPRNLGGSQAASCRTRGWTA